jgi:putative ABC transport system permease protein
LGGAVGLLATLPLNALTYETSDFNSFASITVSFRFGPLVIAVALLMTLAMGLFGGMLPAVRALKLDVITALREL